MNHSTKLQYSQQSKQRIVEAALKMFGLYSFEGATVRMIAEEADANLGLLTYYFNNKQGLYEAAMEYLSYELRTSVTPSVIAARKRLETAPEDQAALVDALNGILLAFAERIVAADDAKQIAHFISREQLEPTKNFKMLYEGAMEEINIVASQIIGKITGKSPQSQETLFRVHAILGQIVVFATSREVIVRAVGKTNYSASQLKKIKETVTQHTELILSGLSEKR